MNIWQILALVVGLGVIGVAMYTPRDPQSVQEEASAVIQQAKAPN
jgi:hypothetical protein